MHGVQCSWNGGGVFALTLRLMPLFTSITTWCNCVAPCDLPTPRSSPASGGSRHKQNQRKYKHNTESVGNKAALCPLCALWFSSSVSPVYCSPLSGWRSGTLSNPHVVSSSESLKKKLWPRNSRWTCLHTAGGVIQKCIKLGSPNLSQNGDVNAVLFIQNIRCNLQTRSLVHVSSRKCGKFLLHVN